MKKKLASKVIAGALTSAMVLSMAACGDNNSGNSSNGSSSNASNNSSSTTPSSSSTPSSAASDGSSAEVEKEPEVDLTSPLSITVELPGTKSVEDENPQYTKLIEDINAYTNMDVSYSILESNSYYAQLGLRYAANDVADVMVVGTDAAFWSAATGGTYTVTVEEKDADGNTIMKDVLNDDGTVKTKDDGTVVQEAVTHEETYTIGDPLFWDLTDYIDDYDNLATIPAATRAAASYNGRMYFIPRSRTLARNGMGFRKDWCEKLNLAFWNKVEAGEDPTWEDFSDMLYAFTYNDPDGNGIDDTCGLLLDQWVGKGSALDIMFMWFGVPNQWGIDKNGDLIHMTQTEEYKTALKAIRQLYADGVINDGSQKGVEPWYNVAAGKARNNLQIAGAQGGVGLQVLDDQRKIETTLETNGVCTSEEPAYWLVGYVLEDEGSEPHCLPTSGFNGAIAISKKNIQTEAQLRRVLQYLNDVNDGEAMNLLEYGWEGITYKLDEDGYVYRYQKGNEEDPKDNEILAANGVESMKYNDGFNQVIAYFTAEANARPVETAPSTAPINVREQFLYNADIPYCVPNYGISFTTDTYVNKGSALDAIIYGTSKEAGKEDEWGAQMRYITGIIDDAGLEEALKSWWSAGGEQMTKEINKMYHESGN